MGQDPAADAGQDHGSAVSTADAMTLDAVEVTARKRKESIQDVPVAVNSISAVQLENNLATDLGKIAELAPQVMIGRNNIGTGGFLTIRGISSSGTDGGIDQSVAVSVDGVPLSRGRVINSTVYDLAQVEVLSGPQALFFGKNSPAGAIVLTSLDPSQSFEAYARGGYEFEAKERYVEGAISGPLTETLSARLAVRGSRMDGWIENVATEIEDPLRPGVIIPGAPGESSKPEGYNAAARLTLTWNPSDSFDANLKITQDRQTMNSMNAYAEIYCSGGQTVPLLLGMPMPNGDCDKDQRVAESQLPAMYAGSYPHGNGGVPHYESDFTLVALTLNKSFSDLTLTSTTGHYNQTVSGSFTADYSPFAYIWNAQAEDYDLTTQEFRISSDFASPVNFMAGVYFERSNREWYNYPDLFHGGYNEQAGNWTSFETAAEVESDSASAFAQVLWDVSERVEFAAGARYTSDEKVGAFENLSIGVTGLSLYPVGQVLTARYKGSNLSPEATLRWKPNDDQMLYFGYKSGYKSGGLSNGAILLSNASQRTLEFDQEESSGFEMGYKSTLLDGRMRLDLNAYRFEYDGLQVAVLDPDTISFLIGNAAQSTTQGVSGSFQLHATDALSLHGNIGYNRARYERYENVQCYQGQTASEGCINGVQDLTGAPLVRAPNLTLQVGGDYRINLQNGAKTDLSLGAGYSSSYQAQTDNHPGGMQDSFWRLNAAVHFMPADERFRVSLIGRNLTNSYYLISASGVPGGTANQHGGQFARPREIAVQFDYRWW